MKLRMKSIAIAAGVAALALVDVAPAVAQEPASTLNGVLDRIRSDTREQSEEAAQRESQFQQNRNQQASLLAQAEQELTALEEEGERLTALFEQNDERILELQDELRAGQGDFGELFGVARQAALDIRGQLGSSNIAVQPGAFEQEDGESLLDRLG